MNITVNKQTHVSGLDFSSIVVDAIDEQVILTVFCGGQYIDATFTRQQAIRLQKALEMAAS